MKKTDTSSECIRSEVFEKQILEHLDSLYPVALRLTRNPIDAQDLLQDAVVRALRFHDKFKQGTHIRAWLVTILRNTFINDYRKKARRPVFVEWTGIEILDARVLDRDMGYFPRQLAQANVLEMLNDQVRLAVDSLPEGHRNALIMADLQDMSYKEIAAAMKCPLGTVMSRLHRGRRLLRKSLAPLRREVVYS